MTTAPTAFERLGGRPALARLVTRFYALMDSDPAYAPLRAMHGPDLAPMAASLTDFLVAWSGGPRDWFEQRPGACIMSLHVDMPAMSPDMADQWLHAMRRAVADCDLPDSEIGDAMLEAFERMGRAMAANARRMRAAAMD